MKAILGIALAFAIGVAGATGAQAAKKPSLPEPKLKFAGTESYEANGFDFTRYKYQVANKAKFGKELFAASPDLPACGDNPKASRTWVDIYAADGKKLYWFCAFTGPEDLDQLWFALTKGTEPPKSVYIEMTDRKTGATARSNRAPTK